MQHEQLGIDHSSTEAKSAARTKLEDKLELAQQGSQQTKYHKASDAFSNSLCGNQ